MSFCHLVSIFNLILGLIYILRSTTNMVMSKEDLIKLGTPAHATYPINNHSTYNSVENCVSNEKSVRIEILEPDVKELLSTCALYNLDQVKQR